MTTSTIEFKPNLHTPIEKIDSIKWDGVVVMNDVSVIDVLWGSFDNFVKWEESYRKVTGKHDTYMESGRLVKEWIRNIGLEGQFYSYGAEKSYFSLYRAAETAKEKGFKYCIAEDLS